MDFDNIIIVIIGSRFLLCGSPRVYFERAVFLLLVQYTRIYTRLVNTHVAVATRIYMRNTRGPRRR